MAKRRMISSEIYRTTRFLRLSFGAQALYSQAICAADDEGAVDIEMLRRDGQFRKPHIAELIEAGYLVRLEGEFVWIRDWFSMNKVPASRFHPSIYHDLIAALRTSPRPDAVVTDMNPDHAAASAYADPSSAIVGTGSDQTPTTGRTGSDQSSTTGRTGSDQSLTTGRTDSDQSLITGGSGSDHCSSAYEDVQMEKEKSSKIAGFQPSDADILHDECSTGKDSKGKDREVECSDSDGCGAQPLYTLGKETLTKEDYEWLCKHFSKEAVDRKVHRILTTPYYGCLNRQTITNWCQEDLEKINVPHELMPYSRDNYWFQGEIRSDYDTSNFERDFVANNPPGMYSDDFD